MKHGVPQGSVLGPLLFLFYINDLPRAIIPNATPLLFADDTSIIITKENAQELQTDLNTCFHKLTEWFQQNSLSLNISKSYFMNFTSKNLNAQDININYENNFITKVQDINFLGININNTLAWKIHTEKFYLN